MMECGPSAGIYYVVRSPVRWEIMFRRYESKLADWDHPEFWENEVAPRLAMAWAASRRTTPERLNRRLRLLTYAFPRGRITLRGGRTRVLHGSDVTSRMKFSRSAIERVFGLVAPQWEDDEHEHCQEDDKETVRRLLDIREDWPAV